MPGRGQPWKVGGTPDNTITSADIKQGTIKLEDLHQEVLDELGGGGGHDIEDEGVPLPTEPTLNFVGAGVTATDSGGKTVVTIPGGGGSFSRSEIADGFTDWFFYDEFFYPQFPTHFPHLEQSSSSTSVPDGVGGVVQQLTNGSSGSIGRINTCGAGRFAVDPTKIFKVIWRIQMPIDVTHQAFICGLTRDQNPPSGTYPFSNKPTPIIAFIWDNNTSNFETLLVTDTPAEIRQDTGVLADTAMHAFEISYDPSGTPTITFKIDGATVATETVDLPVDEGDMPAMMIFQDSGVSTGRIKTDTLFMYNER